MICDGICVVLLFPRALVNTSGTFEWVNSLFKGKGLHVSRITETPTETTNISEIRSQGSFIAKENEIL